MRQQFQQMYGSYLDQESGNVSTKNPQSATLSPDIEEMIGRKLDKDDLREAMKKEENKLQ